MKIGWLQDMDPLVAQGGAELNDRRMILAGFQRGHHIQVITPTDNINDLQEPYDLVVVSNAVGFKQEWYEGLRQRGIPYVFFLHDYGPWLCKWRLFYPMEARCRDLCYLRGRWRETLLASVSIIWLSPLHRSAWLFAYPELRAHAFRLIPSAIDTSRFFDMGQPRPANSVITVNSLVAFKGAENVIRWAEQCPDMAITAAGGNPERRDLPANIRVIDPVPNSQMNVLYNQHEAFAHFPDRSMPFERTVAEAFLAGCRIIGNKNVGALSWDFFKKGRDAVVQALEQAPERFWKEIESYDRAK